MAEKVILYTESDDARINAAVRAYEGKPQYVLPRKKRKRLTGGGGGSCTCPEIWVFLPLAPTAGTFDVTFTFNGISDTVTIDWDEDGESGTGFATAWAAHSEVSSSDFAIYGGDFPTTAIYVHWLTTDASITGSFPTLDLSSLTGAVTFYKLTLNNI